MSAQVLLQGKLIGAEEFLVAAPADRDNRVFEARSMWLILLGEAIPRALLADLQLPPLMLGSSGSDSFVVILPDLIRADAAAQFLTRVSRALSDITLGRIRLVWSATENLGDWIVVRKRLSDGMGGGAEPSAKEPGFFEPFAPQSAGAERIPRDLRDANAIGWSFEYPALISTEPGQCHWDVGSEATISLTRHAARNGDAMASTRELARRAQGQKLWAVLRGEI